MTSNKTLRITIGAGNVHLVLQYHSEVAPGVNLPVFQFRKVCRIAASFMEVASQGIEQLVQIDKDSHPLQVKLLTGGQPHLDIRRMFATNKQGQTQWICTKDGVTLSQQNVAELVVKCSEVSREAEQRGVEAAQIEAEGMHKAHKTLKNAMKACIATESRKRCNGCTINHPSLDQHDMCVMPVEKQVSMFGADALLDMDIKTICKKQKLDGTKTAFLHKAYAGMFASTDAELVEMMTKAQ